MTPWQVSVTKPVVARGTGALRRRSFVQQRVMRFDEVPDRAGLAARELPARREEESRVPISAGERVGFEAPEVFTETPLDSHTMRFRKDAKLDASQVEDYRGRGGRMPGGTPMALGGGGGLIGVVVLVAFLLLSGGGGLGQLGTLEGQQVGPGTATSDLQTECRTGADANEREDCRIVASINSIQAYWQKTLRGYEPARTRFFDGTIGTGCGPASPAVGPFYCPRDRYVYIDLGFFDQLQSQLGARGGPLAEAYILAHEYGHHVQNLTGVLGSAGRDTGPQGGQVRVELQADCYAGLWIGNALETGFIEDITRQDVADALDAAAAVGDDRIQEKAQGRVTPESWTHGSAEQRQSWLVRGIEGSGPQSCDTFRGRV